MVFKNIGDAAHLSAVKRSCRKLNPDGTIAGLTLGHEIVLGPALVLGIGRGIVQAESQRCWGDVDQRRTNGRRHGKNFGGGLRNLALFKNQAAKLSDALFAQNEFHPRFEFVLAIAGFVEDT